MQGRGRQPKNEIDMADDERRVMEGDLDEETKRVYKDVFSALHMRSIAFTHECMVFCVWFFFVSYLMVMWWSPAPFFFGQREAMLLVVPMPVFQYAYADENYPDISLLFPLINLFIAILFFVAVWTKIDPTEPTSDSHEAVVLVYSWMLCFTNGVIASLYYCICTMVSGSDRKRQMYLRFIEKLESLQAWRHSGSYPKGSIS